jgi:PhzF family phenazine biosynthesis protein
MSLPIFVVDAFITDPPFTGNPAAVCVLPLGECDAADIESRLQGIAAEMNLSETAFVAPLEKGDRPNRWALRWFTPNAEVELCGHATLAAAYALRERGLAPLDAPITFRTRHRGDLVSTREGGFESIGLPALPLKQISAPAELSNALGVESDRTFRTGEDDLIVVVDEVSMVEKLVPDLPALAGIECRGVAVTARITGDGGRDLERAEVVSRFFAPRIAVDEDPVTGSLHASLGHLWRDEVGPSFLARQASPRGGVVRVDATNADHGVVTIAGRARLVLVGVFIG